MLKNFKKSVTPTFQDILYADGSKTYDTVYGQITIDRPSLVNEIENFLIGKMSKIKFQQLVTDGKISEEEYNKVMRILD
jgi:hypothetical protein